MGVRNYEVGTKLAHQTYGNEMLISKAVCSFY